MQKAVRILNVSSLTKAIGIRITEEIETVKGILPSDVIKGRMIHVKNEAAGNHPYRLVASRCPVCSPRNASTYGAKLMIEIKPGQSSDSSSKKPRKSES